MYQLVHPPRRYQRVLLYENAFSRYDCEWIDRTAASVPEAPALVGTEHVEKAATRKSLLRWLPPEGPWLWLYERLNDVILRANALIWRYDLNAIQNVQHTEYRAPGGHYTWHQDSGDGPFSKRKLSASVVLTPTAGHEGGVFELFEYGPVVASQGDVILFPSHEFHRVTPVTAGVRRSLVAWVEGPELR
jgi:PKHD-type hydroxylase